MSELKGIFFLSGMQGIGTVKQEGDFYIIDTMLQLVIVNTEKGPTMTFNHVSPFTDETKLGVDAKVHVSAAFLYDVDPSIRDGYYQSTGRIQPISSFSLK